MTPAVARVLENAPEEMRVATAKAKRRAEDAADAAAATRIRKQPFTAVGAAFGAGLVIGMAGAFLATVLGSRWVGAND